MLAVEMNYSSPVIGPENVLMRALINHGFDGEDVASFHESRCLIVRVMRDSRGRVKQIADAMSAVRSVHLQTFRVYVFLYDISNISVHCARLADLYRFFQAAI